MLNKNIFDDEKDHKQFDVSYFIVIYSMDD